MSRNQILFSSSNEDGSSELAALEPSVRGVVLCITGSGSRVLNLLTVNPLRISCIDVNPAQTNLAELTFLAFKHLNSYEDLLRFIGVEACKHRLRTYYALRSHLSPLARQFWDGRHKTIQRGIIYSGKWERIFRVSGSICSILRHNARDQLFQANSLHEQTLAWNRWDTRGWRMTLKLFSWPPLWQYVFKKSGIKLGIEKKPLDSRFNALLKRAASHHLFRTNAFLYLILYGRYSSEGPLPFYLQRPQFTKIKNSSTQVDFHTGSLLSFLSTPSCPEFDAFSLSNFSSYTIEDDYRRTWEKIVSKAKQAARFCERQFLVYRPLEQYVTGESLDRDREMERLLELTDSTLFYKFLIGTIRHKDSDAT
jgi:S-adenosylmethionine-diacylglycerol 3-amino-3-carboxypropyl transferase